MSQSYKYQLILLGKTDLSEVNLETLFLSTVRELEMSTDSFSILTESNLENEYKGNQPSFAIYFGDKKGKRKNLTEVEKLLGGGVPVLPVFKDSFGKEIPSFLSNQNGIQYDFTIPQKIVNTALESFGKLRQSRKIFISYKRRESTSVAIQLYEALEKNNFDCFLDTHSIKPGEPFQDELWHRMTDCDVIVLLNTKGFLQSNWCKEELAEASVKKIGIVQLIWPENKMEATDEMCFPLRLMKSDFVGEVYDNNISVRLTEDKVNEIVSQVESTRARNLASRQDGLITEFLKVAKKVGRKMDLQPQRFITELLPNKKRRIFVPSVGIPQSFDCHQSEEIKKEITEYDIDKLHLIYDDLRIRDKWLKHLEWLNEYLEIKTIKKQKFEEWLQN